MKITNLMELTFYCGRGRCPKHAGASNLRGMLEGDQAKNKNNIG